MRNRSRFDDRRGRIGLWGWISLALLALALAVLLWATIYGPLDGGQTLQGLSL